MKFDFDGLYIEEAARDSSLAHRVLAALPPGAPVQYVDDAQKFARPIARTPDSFAAGKRRIVIANRRAPFLMACPAGSAQFACCGYLVLELASNCPMDCSYCFLQEYLADNPAFQLYANYAEAFEELERLASKNRERNFRVGTGELADSLALDSITGISRDLVEFFSARPNLTLELKTKTDEVGNLLRIDPCGRVLVSWTLSPDRLYRMSEHRTASPSARIAAARAVLDAGYRVAFHFDPIIAYDGADRDYNDLVEELFVTIRPAEISFISMGGLRMTPKLRTIARRRFPNDPMLTQEDVLAPDGRFRACAPLRLRLYCTIAARFERDGVKVPSYLCMEPSSIHERVFGMTPATPANLGDRLATASSVG